MSVDGLGDAAPVCAQTSCGTDSINVAASKQKASLRQFGNGETPVRIGFTPKRVRLECTVASFSPEIKTIYRSDQVLLSNRPEVRT
jgi:hypothetical protein